MLKFELWSECIRCLTKNRRYTVCGKNMLKRLMFPRRLRWQISSGQFWLRSNDKCTNYFEWNGGFTNVCLDCKTVSRIIQINTDNSRLDEMWRNWSDYCPLHHQFLAKQKFTVSNVWTSEILLSGKLTKMVLETALTCFTRL